MVDPQRLNRYSYVRNRPLLLVDPDGRYEAWMHEVITATLLAMAGHSGVSSKMSAFTGDGPGISVNLIVDLQGGPAVFSAHETCPE
jgi:hypothetical protein